MENKNLSRRLAQTAEAAIMVGATKSQKINIVLEGRKTSITIEPVIWSGLKMIAEDEDCHVNHLCEFIDRRRHPDATLSSAIRVFVMSYLMIQIKYYQD